MINWFQKKPAPAPKITEMYYRFLCFPNGSGHVELCSEGFHNLGYAGSFRNQEEMFEIINHLVVIVPPTVEYATCIKFVYRR